MTRKQSVRLYYTIIRLIKLLCVSMLIGLLFASVSIRKVEAATIKVELAGVVDKRHSEVLAPQIEKAKAGDTLDILIVGPGGSVYHGYKVLLALTKTEAKKVCTVETLAASMTALYTLACDELTIKNKTTIMFHLPYDGQKNVREFRHYQIGLEQSHVLGLMDLLPDRLYGQFMKGQDVYIDGETYVVLFNSWKGR